MFETILPAIYRCGIFVGFFVLFFVSVFLSGKLSNL